MKNTLLILCLLLSSALFSQEVETITINSSELNQTREILVYTPMGYGGREYAYFNTIYVFDAHDRAIFDYVTSISHLLKEGHAGFVVVGITATYIEELEYARNHDLLPSDTKVNLGEKSGGNAENFLSYVKNEVVPYVEENYNVLDNRTAVGHSLGASFVVYSLLNEPDLFDNYVAISPNLAYDKERLVNDLRNFKTEDLTSKKYLYICSANEGEYWTSWKTANDKAYPMLRDTIASEKFQVITEEYPNEWHRPVIIPGVKSAMLHYLDNVEPELSKELSAERVSVTFRVTVPNEEDEIFVTGNQEALGTWEPGKIKMKKISATEREITMDVQDPVELKFTRGSWETEAWMKLEDGQHNYSSTIRPVEGETYLFEIASYMDK